MCDVNCCSWGGQ